MERISYEEAQDLLHRMINEGDADTITAIFEYAFARVCNGSPAYNHSTGEIEFTPDPVTEDWFGNEYPA